MSKIDRPIINIDLDNVVSDFSAEINLAGSEALQRPLDNHGQWDIAGQWGVSNGLYKRIFRQAVADWRIWRHSPVVPGAVEGLWELSDAEYYIRLVTHRLNHGFDFRVAIENTVAWLDDNHVPYRSLAVIGDEPKSNYKAEVLLDDAPHNITDWLKRTWDTAVVFDRPWNQTIEIPEESVWENGDIPTLHRAMDWPEAVATIREVVGQ